MNFTDAPYRVLRVPNWGLWLLFACYAFFGLIGHSPWRGDDALNIGIAFDMLRRADPLIPSIADLAIYDNGPLYHWLGMALGTVLQYVMSLHDAIRLAAGVCVALSTASLYFAARRFYNDEASKAVILLSTGTLGLLMPAHESQSYLALMTCSAAMFAGLSIMTSSPLRGNLIVGIAAAGAFLSGGVIGILLVMPIYLVSFLFALRKFSQPLLLRYWLLGFATSLVITLPWIIILSIRRPDYLGAWWQQSLVAASPKMQSLAHTRRFFEMLAWFAWPAWPLALWAIWRHRKLIKTPQILLPLVGTLSAILLIFTTSPIRPSHFLLLLPPLILLAAAGVPQLRRGAANAFDSFGVIIFTAGAAFIWLAWSALYFGFPQPLARNITRLASGFSLEQIDLIGSIQILLCVIISSMWLYFIFRLPFSPLRSVLRWAVGVTLVWSLAASLWRPWFDYGKSYDELTDSLNFTLSNHPAKCIAAPSANDSLRAALFYTGAIRLDSSSSSLKRCSLRLTHATGRQSLPDMEKEWKSIWHYERGRGRQREALALYERVTPPSPPTSGSHE